MKKFFTAALIATSGLLTTAAGAAPVPAIEIEIEGKAAAWVKPELVLNTAEDDVAIELLHDAKGYYHEMPEAGSYTLSIVDKKTGYVILKEVMIVTKKGPGIQGGFRQIDCSVQSGEIVCLNLI